MKKSILLLFLLTNLIAFSQFDPQPSFFRIQREMPLTQLNTVSTIMVSSYGAIVNDGIDDRVAIQNAINAAVNSGTLQNPVRLLFDAGTYDLNTTSTSSHILTMTDAKGVLFDGNGAEFLIHNPVIGFLATLRCTNTIIKDFSIDYATLPFSQGKVTKVDAVNGYFEFIVEDGFPLPVEQHFIDAPQRWGMFKNAKGGIKEGTHNLISHNRFFELIAPRTYRYGNQSASRLSNVEVGDYFVHIARYNGSTAIRNTGGKNLTYINVTSYASPSGGFNSRDSEEWNVINCQLKLKEGRVHSTNADAMHINGSKIGPWVEGCLFEGFSDDCMNLKYTKKTIKEVHSSTEITVEFTTKVGEILEFYNPRDGVYLGTATITNVQNLGSNLFRIKLSDAINITNVNEIDHQSTDKAYVESSSNESFIFRNNIVRNSRRYGLLIQSKYALIENNLFQNLSGSAIRIENGVDWGEGFRADNIEIKNNRFENCGYDKTYIDESNSATITVDFAKLQSPCDISNSGFCGTTTSTWRGHSNIRIIDNTILYNKRGLYLKNIEGLTVKNNFICHRDEDITLSNNESPIERTIFNSGNQVIEEYNFTTPDAPIHFLLNEEASAQGIQNSGSNTAVTLQVNTNGGTINQGFFDSEIGNSFQINTLNNGSLSMVNTSDNSSYSGATGGEARSITFWVKPEEAIFQTFLYSGGPTNGEVFSIQMEASGVLRVTDNDQNFVKMIDMPLTIGSWNHIAITLPSNNTFNSIQLYKDGVASTETHFGSNPLLNTATNGINFFPRYKGLASDIRYFTSTLCGSEIESIFNDRRTTLSVDENTFKDNKIHVYPTVVSSSVFFSEPVHSVKVVNILGKTFVSKNNSSITELDLSFLSSGFYILQINQKQVVKILKK